jgi:endonuclease/exonuclease/phosphatase family metal-dependent hydrolase
MALLAVLPCAAAAQPAPRLTVVSLNLLHGGVWSGLTGDDEDLEPRLEIATTELRALAPDVVGVQEASVGRRRGHVARRLAEALGMHWAYAPALVRVFPFAWLNRLGSMIIDFEEGPAVLSRFPIVDWEVDPLPRCNGLFDPRMLVLARLDTPWGRMVAASAHTSRGLCEAERVVQLMTAGRQALPAVLTGDFNTGPDADGIRRLTDQAGFVDAFHAANPTDPGHTVWQRVTSPTPTVHRRVDYVFLVPGTIVPGRVVGSRLVLNKPGRLADGRVLWPTDHYGVLAEIDLSPPAEQ